MADLKEFSKRLKQLRLNLGISQRKMAEKIGITGATLSAYETNLKNPSISVVIDISNVFEVSIDWLCGIDDTKDIKEYKYSDIFVDLIKLGYISNIHLGISDVPIRDNTMASAIYFDNKYINTFVSEWVRMVYLFKDGLIDGELYKLWIEKSLKKHNFNIADERIETMQEKSN